MTGTLELLVFFLYCVMILDVYSCIKEFLQSCPIQRTYAAKSEWKKETTVKDEKLHTKQKKTQGSAKPSTAPVRQDRFELNLDYFHERLPFRPRGAC